MTDEPITAVTQWLLPCPCCDGRGTHDPECSFAEDCPADYERLSAEWERLVGACHEARLAGAREMQRTPQELALAVRTAREMRERALHIANLALEGFYSPEDVARQIAALPDEPEPLL